MCAYYEKVLGFSNDKESKQYSKNVCEDNIYWKLYCLPVQFWWFCPQSCGSCFWLSAITPLKTRVCHLMSVEVVLKHNMTAHTKCLHQLAFLILLVIVLDRKTKWHHIDESNNSLLVVPQLCNDRVWSIWLVFEESPVWSAQLSVKIKEYCWWNIYASLMNFGRYFAIYFTFTFLVKILKCRKALLP